MAGGHILVTQVLACWGGPNQTNTADHEATIIEYIAWSMASCTVQMKEEEGWGWWCVCGVGVPQAMAYHSTGTITAR